MFVLDLIEYIPDFAKFADSQQQVKVFAYIKCVHFV